MKHLRTVILFCALAAVGWWLWTIFFPSQEKIIRGRLADLANTVSFTGKENVIVRANNIGRLPTFFAPEVEINIDLLDQDGRTIESHRIVGHDEIAQAAQGAHATGGTVQVEFMDPVVKLAADKESAVVNVTLRAKIPRDANFIIQEMKFTLKKVKKDWLIIRVETVKTLA